MREFLLTRFNCAKCGGPLQVGSPDDQDAAKTHRRDGEPSGAYVAAFNIAVQPCRTCLRPAEDVMRAMETLMAAVNKGQK